MRIPFFIYMLLSVSTSSAYTMTCDIVSINGETPIKPASLSFSNDEILLEINRGNGPEKLFTSNSIYIADANAIWFDRVTDCQYQQKNLTPHLVRHQFECGKDVSAEIKLSVDASISGGIFKSVLKAPNFPDYVFEFSFLRCL